ncbi:MAG: VOC family protein [Alphaproteobacteria bacterium]
MRQGEDGPGEFLPAGATEDRQLPRGDEVFLDHVGFFVPDMDAAARTFERLGFAVQPQNTHFNAGPDGGLVPAGTANRLITTRIGYLEILAATLDTPLAAQLRAGLARYTGLHLVALGHADVPAQETRLRAAGMRTQPAVRLRRPLDALPDRPLAGFHVLRTEAGVMPEGRVQYCGHETPDRVWLPDWLDHANGAEALTDFLIVAADPDEAAGRFALFAGRPANTEPGGLRAVRLDRGRLTLCGAQTAAGLLPGFRAPALPFEAGLALRVADPAHTLAFLRGRGVAATEPARGIVHVPPAEAMGAHMLFHAHRDAGSVWAALAAAAGPAN